MGRSCKCCGKSSGPTCTGLCYDLKNFDNYEFVFYVCNFNKIRDDDFDIYIGSKLLGSVTEFSKDRDWPPSQPPDAVLFYTSTEMIDIFLKRNNLNSMKDLSGCGLNEGLTKKSMDKNIFRFCSVYSNANPTPCSTLKFKYTKSNGAGSFGYYVMYRYEKDTDKLCNTVFGNYIGGFNPGGISKDPMDNINIYCQPCCKKQ